MCWSRKWSWVGGLGLDLSTVAAGGAARHLWRDAVGATAAAGLLRARAAQRPRLLRVQVLADGGRGRHHAGADRPRATAAVFPASRLVTAGLLFTGLAARAAGSWAQRVIRGEVDPSRIMDRSVSAEATESDKKSGKTGLKGP